MKSELQKATRSAARGDKSRAWQGAAQMRLPEVHLKCDPRCWRALASSIFVQEGHIVKDVRQWPRIDLKEGANDGDILHQVSR